MLFRDAVAGAVVGIRKTQLPAVVAAVVVRLNRLTMYVRDAVVQEVCPADVRKRKKVTT